MKTWRDYLLSISLAILLALLTRAFLIGVYKVPTGSMQPSLKPGDFIFVSKLKYGIKIPFTNYKLFESEPQRGDVLIFNYKPKDDIVYVKRVVGLPGDVLEIKERRLIVNGIPMEYSLIENDRDNPQSELFDVWSETSNLSTIRVIFEKNTTGQNYGPYTVPQGEVFVLGDNRDASDDSRYWGSISQSLIIGRVSLIWLSLDLTSTVNDASLPQIRWNRIFKTLH